MDTSWFRDQIEALESGKKDAKSLYTAIGLVPRKVGKTDLQLTTSDHEQAHALVSGWDPTGYSVDMAARLALLLTAAESDPNFFEAFDMLWRTADVGEQVIFYRGLPLYPKPEQYLWRATDGCRTNIKGVFEAIAHRNPYTAEHFDEVAFNQVCLKALFVGSNLYLVQGIDDRMNPRLSRMMTDYAYERWAASRTVYPELWRCVAPHPDERCLKALERALAEEDELTQQAAALACFQSGSTASKALLQAHPDLAAHAASGDLDWPSISAAFSA
jgi:hypothetical protein